MINVLPSPLLKTESDEINATEFNEIEKNNRQTNFEKLDVNYIAQNRALKD